MDLSMETQYVPPRRMRGSVQTSTTDRHTTSGLFMRVDERSLLVRAAMRRLPDVLDRSILVLRFFVGLSLDEIAVRLMIPRDVALERYRVGIRMMERELGPCL
jgi:DNA-directed RNA polymerase specialized sigma24 family protein